VELKGTQQIRSPRPDVWTALNDPDVLQQCIPGCEALTKDSDNTYRIVIMAAVGPVKAKFTGKLVLSDIRENEGYVLSFEGSGGVAGFGKGGAAVLLETIEEGTLLTYEANAKVGGKLAQVGARLIDGVAAKMAEEFFSRFKALMEKSGSADTATTRSAPHDASHAASPASPVTPDAPPEKSNMPRIPTIALLVIVAVVSFLLGRMT